MRSMDETAEPGELSERGEAAFIVTDRSLKGTFIVARIVP